MNDLNQLLNPQAAPQQQAPQAPPQYAPQPQAPAPQQYAQPQAPAPQQYAQPQAPAPPQYAPQYAPQHAPQAPAVGQPQQAQGPAPLAGGMAQYASASQGLFNEVGTSAPRIYFDCEGTFIVQLERLTTGRSTNVNKNAGRPFLGANFKILRTEVQKAEATGSQIRDGVEVSWMTWLPRDPNYMSTEDKYNLADALTLGASVIGLKQADPNGNPYINFAILDQMCQDDGAIAKGKIFGVQVVGKPGKGKDGTTVTYYNARFFPVDAQWQRHDGLTPQELQARNAQG